MRRFLNPFLALAIVTSLSLAAVAQVDLVEAAADAAQAATEAVAEVAEEAAEAVEEVAEAAAETAAEATEAVAEAAADAAEAATDTPEPAAEPTPEVAEPEAPAAEPAAEVEAAAVEAPAAVPATEVSAPSVDDVIAAGSGSKPMMVEPMTEPMVVAWPVVEAAPCCEPVCCPIDVVSSRVRRSAKRAYACHGGPIETTVCVDNPADCDCQKYAVSLCVPCCCVGEPQVCGSKAGLLGRGHVTLQWDCGFTAKVTFLKRGGVTVVYGG